MNEVLHANIFFIIASIATVMFVIMVCIAMYHVIKILRSVRTIVERIAEGSDVLAEDVSAMRDFVKSGGLVSYIINRVMPKERPTRQARRRSSASSDE
jgi:hypothetical protein